MPWQDCCLRTDDFLVCRLLEILVHADDLAVTVGCASPVFDDDVLDPVMSLLATLSARRHGQGAVLRALSRAERAPGAVSAFGGSVDLDARTVGPGADDRETRLNRSGVAVVQES